MLRGRADGRVSGGIEFYVYLWSITGTRDFVEGHTLDIEYVRFSRW